MTIQMGDIVRLNMDLSHHIIGTISHLTDKSFFVRGTIQFTSGDCNSYPHRTVPFKLSEVHHVVGHVITLNNAYLDLRGII